MLYKLSIIYVCFYKHSLNSSQGSRRSQINTQVTKELVKPNYLVF